MFKSRLFLVLRMALECCGQLCCDGDVMPQLAAFVGKLLAAYIKDNCPIRYLKCEIYSEWHLVVVFVNGYFFFLVRHV